MARYSALISQMLATGYTAYNMFNTFSRERLRKSHACPPNTWSTFPNLTLFHSCTTIEIPSVYSVYRIHATGDGGDGGSGFLFYLFSQGEIIRARTYARASDSLDFGGAVCLSLKSSSQSQRLRTFERCPPNKEQSAAFHS